MPTNQKSLRASTNHPVRVPSAGPEGLALAPPAYGIDFLDQAQQPIQRKQGDKAALAEKEYVIVGGGEQIKWTDLIGGCIAFAFKYKGGGGMGYHMVMNDDEGGQWDELISKVTIDSIESIHMFSDQLHSADGWRVPCGYKLFDDDDVDMGGSKDKPKTSGRIRSTTDLKESGIVSTVWGYVEGNTTYWSHEWGDIKAWMKGIFGVAPTYEEKMKGVTYTF